jgi:N-acetylneuraminic acid mutarotase
MNGGEIGDRGEVLRVVLCAGLLLWAAVPVWGQRPAKDVVAVLDLEAVEATKVQALAFTDRVREELVSGGNFTLVDRAQMNAVLDEQALQQTGCTSQECAVKVGKILGVRKLVTGRLTKIDSELWQVSAMMVDVETAETLRAVSVQHVGPYRTLLLAGAGSLVGKLAGGQAAAKAAPTGVAPTPGTEPRAGGWVLGNPMPTPRMGAAAGTIAGQIYVAGGALPNDRSDVLEVYNPRNDAWSTRNAMPTSRGWVAGATHGDKLYVIGGFRFNDKNVTDRVDIFNPATNKWSRGSDMPTSRAFLAAVALDDEIYAIGGEALGHKALPVVEAYQPKTDKWKPVAPLSRPRLAPTAAAYEGKIYVFGGRESGSGARLNSMEIFYPRTNEWRAGKRMLASANTATAFVLDGEIFIVGGIGSGGTYLDSVQVYDPAKNSWRSAPALPSARFGAVGVVVASKAYVIGGRDASKEAVGTLQVFTP